MENITLLDSEIKMPLLHLPVRSPTVQLQNARILISPGSKLSQDQLKGLQNVTDIVAPNQLHSAGVPQALALFPQARVWGAPELRKLKPEIKWTHTLTKYQWLYQDELPAIPLNGMPKLNEMVFVHRSSRSLIVCDLCFNLLGLKGIGPWLVLHLFGTYNRFGVSRYFVQLIEDKWALKKSLEELLTYDFDRIIVGHGDLVLEDGKNKLIMALRERDLI